MPFPILRLLTIFVGIAAVLSFSIPDVEFPQNLTDNPLGIDDQKHSEALVGSISEWLGPLAPIAISPFFGITCLAAISQFGGDYLPVNSFISSNPALNNPTVLWVFLGLTLITSIPRFTKISKPIAQAIDQIEAYAGIITILVIRFLPGILENHEPAAEMAVQMGILTFSADVVLAIAAVINIVVINSVKFFFEVLVWLIPFPFIDAALEIANKTICAGLMAIYAVSPLAASLINLLLFLGCLVVFRWVHRQVTYLRAILGDPAWAFVNPKYGIPRRDRLTVFPKQDFDVFPAKSRLFLQATPTGWLLVQPRFLLPSRSKEIVQSDSKLTMREGFLVNSIDVDGPEAGCLLFSSRYRKRLDELAHKFNLGRSKEVFQDDLGFDLQKA